MISRTAQVNMSSVMVEVSPDLRPSGEVNVRSTSYSSYAVVSGSSPANSANILCALVLSPVVYDSMIIYFMIEETVVSPCNWVLRSSSACSRSKIVAFFSKIFVFATRGPPKIPRLPPSAPNIGVRMVLRTWHDTPRLRMAGIGGEGKLSMHILSTEALHTGLNANAKALALKLEAWVPWKSEGLVHSDVWNLRALCIPTSGIWRSCAFRCLKFLPWPVRARLLAAFGSYVSWTRSKGFFASKFGCAIVQFGIQVQQRYSTFKLANFQRNAHYAATQLRLTIYTSHSILCHPWRSKSWCI